MAMPVEFRKFTPRNSRDDLTRRLEQAPEAHAEALLSAYDLLQKMHEKGLIDIANGLLSAGDTVVDRAVDVASSRQAVTALRVALMFSNLLVSLDPDKIHALLTTSDAEPPSLLTIGKQAMSADARMGMGAALGLLSVFGEALRKQKSS
jgi:uncharacterized protein YjgD (DUF1641 family)